MTTRKLLFTFFTAALFSVYQAPGFCGQQKTQANDEESKTLKIEQKQVKAFKKIQKSFARQNYDKATELLNKLSNKNGLNNLELAYISNYRGNICFEKKDFECSLLEFQSILDKKSGISKNYIDSIAFVIAQLHFQQKSYTDAINYIEQYLLTNTNFDVQANAILSRSYFRLGQYQRAQESLQHLVDFYGNRGFPLNPALINQMIDIYMHLDQLESAVDFVDSLDSVNPKTKHKLRIARLYRELGQEEKMESLHKDLIDQGHAGYKGDKLLVWQTEGLLLPKYRPQPKYPRRALKRGLEGWVDIIMDIDKSGLTYNVRVSDSSIENIFDSSAIRSVQGYIFDPVIKNGEPTEVKDYLMRVLFRLASDKKRERGLRSSETKFQSDQQRRNQQLLYQRLNNRLLGK